MSSIKFKISYQWFHDLAARQLQKYPYPSQTHNAIKTFAIDYNCVLLAINNREITYIAYSESDFLMIKLACPDTVVCD